MATEPISFNWKEYSLKGIARILIGLAVLLLLFFVIVSLIYFPPKGMSSSLENLGLYGDYFGGIVGGITSIATLGITIYLALVLQRLEKENNESAIEAQRKVAIMQMKFQELEKFQTVCDKEMEAIHPFGRNFSEIHDSGISILMSTSRLLTRFQELSECTDLEVFNFTIQEIKNSCYTIVKANQLAVGGAPPPVDLKKIKGELNSSIERARQSYIQTLVFLSKWTLS